MACYAAVLSLMHTLNHINEHPSPPICLNSSQADSLTQNITFFQHFLERYSGEEEDDLESRIAAAAYAAEDLIEMHIVEKIHHARSTSNRGKRISSFELYEGLERVIQDMNLIKKEVMEIKIMRPQHLPHLHTNSSASTSTWQSTTPVLDDTMIYQVLDKLTGQQSRLQIILIVGMGGIGKTTFAHNIYKNKITVHHFDICVWVTISQEYSRRNILQVLCQEVRGSTDDLISGMSEYELGERVYQKLWGVRYLIVMDDMWSIEAFDKVKSFFPNNNESRILITTRLSNLDFESSSSHVFQMQFLDADKSWDLLCKTMFGNLDCPNELEKIGKEIAINCRGLPLSIVVIGGLLKKSEVTRAHWEHTLQNLNAFINLENNEYCLQILRTSYKELPMHLKPCFLYMRVFPEDSAIKVSQLIKLWVSEGILKPNDDKSLEEVAKDYLKELIDRNLILVQALRWNGEAKLFKIHDLLREVCSREAKKQKFICIVRQHEHHTTQGINMERCICVDYENEEKEHSPEFLRDVEFALLNRSLLYCCMRPTWNNDSPSLHFQLLRVYSPVHKVTIATYFENTIFEQANLRYLYMHLNNDAMTRFYFLCSLLWNLQTLEVSYSDMFKAIAPPNIWEMPLLRHAAFQNFYIPNPLDGEHKFVLENLQTLSCTNLMFSEKVVKGIPNVKKLKVDYIKRTDEYEKGWPDLCLHNLGCLQKLESLCFHVRYSTTYCEVEDVWRNLMSFPHSLKKLTLYTTWLSWEELQIKIGSLPLLQVLRLKLTACRGPKWETVEGQFCSLRILQIEACFDLKFWDTDNNHFPLLEHLLIQHLFELEEIPSSIGDIPTLKSIRLEFCSSSAEDSAKRIKNEQEENGNEDLQVIIVSEDDPVDEVDSDELN